MARRRTDSRIRLTNIRREQLLDRCKGKCLHCGADLSLGDNFSIEHIIPLAKGGTNEFRNTVALCKDCNFDKCDDIVPAEFYSYAPKLVYEDIENLLNEYYDNNDWLSATQVFKHDRYTIKTQQFITTKGGKMFTKEAVCELRKVRDADYENLIGEIEEIAPVVSTCDNGEALSVSNEGQPFQVIFKGKTVALMKCGLDAQKDRAEFRVVLNILKDTVWGPSSRVVIIDCINEILTKFRESVEAKGTKGIVLCCVDADAKDKRAVSVAELLAEVWRTHPSNLVDVDTDEILYKRVACATSFGIDVETDEDGTVSVEEFSKKSKLYGGQLKRRVNKNKSL